MVIIDIVINTIFGRVTLDPAGMHCPSWNDAFVSSWSLKFVSHWCFSPLNWHWFVMFV